MPIDYRYHIGSFVAIFIALLLGILVGIGLAPNPEELNEVVAKLKEEYRQTQQANEDELRRLRQAVGEYEALSRETVAALISGRLVGHRVAIIVDHDPAGDPLPDNLRALLKQAGAALTSTTTIARDFVSLPDPVRRALARRLSFYPPPGVHFRSLIAEAIARDLAQGRSDLIRELHASGLLKSSADSNYQVPVDSVLLVGGPNSPKEASPERIDLPLIAELTRLGVWVVGCESSQAETSSIPLYKSKGIPTVDNADTLAGRLTAVLALAGTQGHFGIKETADRLLPDLSAAGRR